MFFRRTECCNFVHNSTPYIHPRVDLKNWPRQFRMTWICAGKNMAISSVRHGFLVHLSRRLTRWAYNIPVVRRPSIVRPSSVVVQLEYLKSQLDNLDHILCVASLGWGKNCIKADWIKTLVSMATESPHWHCLHLFSVLIIIKVAGNQARQKSLDEFDFGPDQTTHFGVTCPWMTKLLHFRTWISLRPVGQSWSYFMCNIIVWGKAA